jgi:hypothetical protein
MTEKNSSSSVKLKNGMRLVPTLVEVVVLALWVEVALRRRPFERVLSEVAQTGVGSHDMPEIPSSTVKRAIRAAYRLLPLESTCLKQSLIFCRFRRRRGLPAELRIGVQKNEGVFAAHAWVEDDQGNVLTDPQEGFSPMPLPESSNPGGTASG